MDGSRRISVRNRQFLRKYTPIEHPLSQHTYEQQTDEQSSPNTQNPSVYDCNNQPVNLKDDTREEDTEVPMLLHPEPVSSPEPTGSPGHQNEISPTTSNHPIPADGSPATVTEPVGDRVEMTPTVRRSTRSTKGQTTRLQDFVTGSQFDNATNGLALLAYKLPAGYEQVSFMWNGFNWEVLPTRTYV